MLSIAYPEPDFRLKKENEKEYLFDNIRKKWLLLTPEEWVRQNFIQYLLQVRQYPATLVAVEKMLILGELKKRFDILVYDGSHRPWLMVECKSPQVALDDSVLQQVLRYNISVPVNYLVITNGNSTYGWEKKGKDLVLIHSLPPMQ